MRGTMLQSPYMDVWRLIADRKIEEAQAEGAFDNLSGTGRPLDLCDNPFEDPSTRLANRLLKNNGFAPGWIEEGRQIQKSMEEFRSRAVRAHRDAAQRPALRDGLRDLNRRIAGYNLKAPSTAQIRVLDADRELGTSGAGSGPSGHNGG
jgi:DnaJ family protein C protein 28